MPAYLVRNYETKSLLGVYVALSKVHLWDKVDEIVDPVYYEYIRFSDGALFFPEKEPENLSIRGCYGEDGPEYTFDAENLKECLVALDDELDEKFGRRKGWKRFDSATEGVSFINRIFWQVRIDD